MKFEITAEALAPALARIKRASGKDEILQHCMVRIESGIAELIATDNTMQLSTTVDATGDCEILLPLAKLEKTAKAQSGPISFEVKENKTTAKVGDSKYSIANLPADDFPEKPDFNERKEIVIDAYTLACMIDDVSYAQATSDVRFYLNGLHVRVIDGVLRVAATDGHRMAISTQKVDCNSDFELIIPVTAVSEFRRLLNDVADNASLIYGDSQMMLQAGNCQLITSLVDGSYPDIDSAIVEPERKIGANRKDLCEAAKRAAIFANPTTGGAAIKIAGDSLTIDSFNPFGESALERTTCRNDTSDPIEFGASLNYIGQALDSMDADDIDIGFSEHQMIIFPSGKNDVMQVIMAMRL